MGRRPALTVAIPSWNGRHLLEPCLRALAAARPAGEPVEVAVFDNGSEDGTAAWLERSHPDVRLLRSPRNLGFAGACNRLVREARTPLVLLLNNDVEVEPGAVAELLEARELSGAACVGARILSGDGRLVEFDGGTMNFYGHGAGWRHGARAADLAAEREPRPTLFACGAAMLVERDVFLEAGGFDECYFAYFEDVDLGWRLWLLGRECAHAPAARVRHRGQASERALGGAGRLPLLERNALLTIYKNYEPGSADRLFTCALVLAQERMRLAPQRADACRAGVASATAEIPSAGRKRAALERLRVRSDREIAPLFVDPWRRVVAGAEYARVQADLARRFDVARRLGLEPGLGATPAGMPAR